MANRWERRSSSRPRGSSAARRYTRVTARPRRTCSSATVPRWPTFARETIGLPGPGHEIAVVDPETAEPLEPGTAGEIAVRYEDDPVCFEEYWNDPEATAEKVRNGWLCTEDLGEMDGKWLRDLS